MTLHLRTCRYPGCDRVLANRNTMGVCKLHCHAPGICQCHQCRTRISVQQNVTQGVRMMSLTNADRQDLRAERAAEICLETILHRHRWTPELRDSLAKFILQFAADEHAHKGGKR